MSDKVDYIIFPRKIHWYVTEPFKTALYRKYVSNRPKSMGESLFKNKDDGSDTGSVIIKSEKVTRKKSLDDTTIQYLHKERPTFDTDPYVEIPEHYLDMELPIKVGDFLSLINLHHENDIIESILSIQIDKSMMPVTVKSLFKLIEESMDIVVPAKYNNEVVQFINKIYKGKENQVYNLILKGMILDQKLRLGYLLEGCNMFEYIFRIDEIIYLMTS